MHCFGCIDILFCVTKLILPLIIIFAVLVDCYAAYSLIASLQWNSVLVVLLARLHSHAKCLTIYSAFLKANNYIVCVQTRYFILLS